VDGDLAGVSSDGCPGGMRHACLTGRAWQVFYGPGYFSSTQTGKTLTPRLAEDEPATTPACYYPVVTEKDHIFFPTIPPPCSLRGIVSERGQTQTVGWIRGEEPEGVTMVTFLLDV